MWLEIERVGEPELLKDISMNFVLAFGKDLVISLYMNMLKAISRVNKTNFLQKIETQFDQIHNVNRSSRRREERQRSRTPPPSYEEVSSMLDLWEFSTSQRERSRSPRRTSNDSRRNVNINQSNQGFEIDIQNMGSRIPVLAENISDNSNIENNVQEDNDR